MLLRAGCRIFLAADNNVADLQRVTPQHQTGAHAEATDGAVPLHIDRWRFDVVFLQASSNAVKSEREKGTRTSSLTLNQRIKQRNKQ